MKCNLVADSFSIKIVRLGNYHIKFWEHCLIQIVRKPIFWGKEKVIAEWRVKPFSTPALYIAGLNKRGEW